MALDPSIDAAMRYVVDMTFVVGSFDGCVVLVAKFENIIYLFIEIFDELSKDVKC